MESISRRFVREAHSARHGADRHHRATRATDQGRGHDYNQALSERRAQTVRALLVERGVDAGKVTYGFKGDTEQVQQCAGVKPQAALRECLIPNRRVEVRLHVAR